MCILNNGLLKGQCAMSADKTKGKPVKTSWDGILPNDHAVKLPSEHLCFCL